MKNHLARFLRSPVTNTWVVFDIRGHFQCEKNIHVQEYIAKN